MANSLDSEIRDDNVKFFDCFKERIVFNAREHKRDSNFQSPPRASGSSKQTKGLNKKGQERLKPAPSSTSSLGKKQGDKRFKANKGKGDAPGCLKCGSTYHFIVDSPEAIPDDRIRKGKKVKFSALVQKLSVDTLKDPSRLPCARLNYYMEMDLDPISR